MCFRSSLIAVAVSLLATQLTAPRMLAKEILVSSFTSDSVGRFDTTGNWIADLPGSGVGGGLDGVLATRVGPDGLLYVASEGSNEILRYNTKTWQLVDTFITAGRGGLNGPTGMTWDVTGDLYVSSFNNDSVLRFDGQTGDYLNTPVAGGLLNGPDNGTVFGPDGLLYIPSYFNNRILRFDPSTGVTETFIASIGRPRVLVFHTDGLLYITSETADAVRQYAADGTFLGPFIRPGQATLDTPVGLAYDDGFWYVTSATGDNVLRFDASGDLFDEFIPPGGGGIDAPLFVTIVPEPWSASLAFLAMAVVLVTGRVDGSVSFRTT